MQGYPRAGRDGPRQQVIFTDDLVIKDGDIGFVERAPNSSDDESEDGSDDDNGSPPTPRPTQSFDRRRLTVDQRSTTAADLEAIAKQYNEGKAEAKAKGGKSPTSPSGKKGGFSLFGRSK